jgi:hypothetical protein
MLLWCASPLDVTEASGREECSTSCLNGNVGGDSMQKLTRFALRYVPSLVICLLSFGGLCFAQEPPEVAATAAGGRGSVLAPSGWLEFIVPIQKRIDVKPYGFYIGNLKAPVEQLDVSIRATKFLTITPSYMHYSVPASGLNELPSQPARFTRSYEEHQFRIDSYRVCMNSEPNHRFTSLWVIAKIQKKKGFPAGGKKATTSTLLTPDRNDRRQRQRDSSGEVRPLTQQLCAHFAHTCTTSRAFHLSREWRYFFGIMVPGGGVEPPRAEARRILRSRAGSERFWKFSTLFYFSMGYKLNVATSDDWIWLVLNIELLQFYYSALESDPHEAVEVKFAVETSRFWRTLVVSWSVMKIFYSTWFFSRLPAETFWPVLMEMFAFWT